MGQVWKILGLAAPLGGCATKAMREQAGVLAAAGGLREREEAAFGGAGTGGVQARARGVGGFAAARTGVVQLRQRSIVEVEAEVATTGQQNAATLAQWRVAGTDDRARRLALFEGVRAASEAMYEVRDQSLMWEESVLATQTA